MSLNAGLCYSAPIYLSPKPLCSGVKEGYTMTVYYNACCELIVLWQGDWRRMRGRSNLVCGTSRPDPMPQELFDTQRGTSVFATSYLSPVHSHFHHPSQHWLTPIWLVDFMFELWESNSIGWHPVTRVGLEDIVFVPGVIGWHCAWPIGVDLSGFVCFDALWLAGLVRW